MAAAFRTKESVARLMAVEKQIKIVPPFGGTIFAGIDSARCKCYKKYILIK